jgi:hypothetical protein
VAARVFGAVGVFGGLLWLLKVSLIWENGGSNTTDGVIGLLFLAGAVALAVTAVGWGWHLPRSGRIAHRAAAAVAGLFGLVAAVDLPIVLVRPLLGGHWLAEEVGVLLTALVTTWAGIRWLRRPHASPFARRPTAPSLG